MNRINNDQLASTMNGNQEIREKIEALAQTEPRYRKEAFLFICQAVTFVNREMKGRTSHAHVDSQTLLEGFCQLALLEFGPLALDVLAYWGIESSEDVGNLVFALVDKKILRASPNDSPADFAGAQDFHRTLLEPFADEYTNADFGDWSVII